MPAHIHAVVPVKDRAQAKGRLAGVLDAKERSSLCRAMLEDLLDQLIRARSLAGISLVACDDETIALADRYRVECLVEEKNEGHDAAVAFASNRLADRGVQGFLQLPGDIPGVRASEIDRLIAAHASAPAFTIAPSHDRRGSNAIVCSPPDLLPLRFGDDSFRAHLAKARALGIEPMVVESPGIARDIDTLDDILAFLSTPAFLSNPCDTRTRRFLVERGFKPSNALRIPPSNPGSRAASGVEASDGASTATKSVPEPTPSRPRS
ncbi:2-phospho-L-lactate guanylyltransferase [Thioalkalivibrio sp. HK1]|uniref:2-phospho-L-lactate guanylyltransferase n=1 Tax=Thioalkalivibrio sp. HK1 TaxID=1469245 RepID=UPI0018CC78FE|nr:2-phospho-L-lactate guanylyltransferase [Thioalkalivibrio sp. HK1]